MRLATGIVSGIHDDASIGYAAESLRLLRAEIVRRTERLKALPRELCPDKRVTREIANRRSAETVPDRVPIDEVQNLFTHPSVRQGKQATPSSGLSRSAPRSASYLSWPHNGQTPSRCRGASAPTSPIRLCLKVMDQIENDMVLGTSAYKKASGHHVPRGIDAGSATWSAAAAPRGQVQST